MKKLMILSLAAGLAAVALRPASGQGLLSNPGRDSDVPIPVVEGRPSPAFGTANASYVAIGAQQFAPFTSTQGYSDLGVGSGNVSRYATGGVNAFIVEPSFPSGALLSSLTLNFCDSNTGGNHVLLYFGDCTAEGTLCASIGPAPTLISTSDVGTPCRSITADISALNYTVDNVNRKMLLEVTTSSLDNTNSISGVVVGYKLQVSPAPAVASFADVPTSSPIFRFVEALKASGITAGCDATHFCPNANLTRGQMAVFLAAGLGLQWQ